MKKHVGVNRRKLNELALVKEYMDFNPDFSYRVLKYKVGESDIPEIFEFTFNMRSFVGIQADDTPIIGEKHVFTFDMGGKYPMQKPELLALTYVWHPNIKFYHTKRSVCFNWDATGNVTVFHILSMLYDMLRYDNYWAENEPPYPDDLEVALWVRKVGEPKGYIKQLKDYYIELENLQNAKINDGDLSKDQNTRSRLSLEESLVRFVHEYLAEMGSFPIMPQHEELNPALIWERFVKENNALNSDDKTEPSSRFGLISLEIDRLINEGKIYPMF